MKIVKFIFILNLIAFLLYSCNPSNDIDTIEIIHDKITITKPFKILVDSEVCFKISVNDKKYKIVEGIVNCKDSASNFNMEKKTFLKCNELLVLEKDTAIFWATYTQRGIHYFQDLRFILVNNDNNKYHYLDTSFQFFVNDIK